MRLPIYQLDAFSSAVFRGNPAAVVPLEDWLSDELMQSIAAENNLSETAFFVPRGEAWGLRWFTPKVEVDLCGHATLASAYVIFSRLRPQAETVDFDTRSGRLSVSRDGQRLALDFPAMPARRLKQADLEEKVSAALGRKLVELWLARDLMAVFEKAEDVAGLEPDMAAIMCLDAFALMATAPGEVGVDFVSRFFAPSRGISEDPVTGSAHCTLAPYWGERLGRPKLAARQLSQRGGELTCEVREGRVIIGGAVAPYLEGAIELSL